MFNRFIDMFMCYIIPFFKAAHHKTSHAASNKIFFTFYFLYMYIYVYLNHIDFIYYENINCKRYLYNMMLPKILKTFSYSVFLVNYMMTIL